MSIDLKGQVAIVTGAGGGLGRCHALALAKRGAKVVVNDLGGARDGTGSSSDAAKKVVEEIFAIGGEAIDNGANVAKYHEVEQMVAETMASWGRVDILVNNAGILRDKSFLKMEMSDFKAVIDVHLMGSVHCTKAVWEIMREQKYGRIVMTTSTSGIYGNFGQANYAAAKMAVIGLMNDLCIEGQKYDIRVNCLCPTAGTRMTEDIMPPKLLELFDPELVSPGLVFLCSKESPNRKILYASGGGFAVVKLGQTEGVVFSPKELNADQVAAKWSEIDGGPFPETLAPPNDLTMRAAEAQGLSL